LYYFRTTVFVHPEMMGKFSIISICLIAVEWLFDFNNSIYPPVDISALWQTQIYLIQKAFMLLVIHFSSSLYLLKNILQINSQYFN